MRYSNVYNSCNDRLNTLKLVQLLLVISIRRKGLVHNLADNGCIDGLGSVSFPPVYLCLFQGLWL